jgi:hypothetical protein
MPRKSKAVAAVEEDVFKASQSKVKTWLKCKRAYHYKYVEKLKRIRVGRPLQFGRIVHEMIEAFSKNEDPFELLDKIELDNEKLFRAEQEMYGELIADIGFIMEDYFSYWSGKDKNAYKVIPIKGVLAEHEFTLPIEKGLVLTGKVDAVGQTRDKMKWLIEHKSFNRRPSEEFRWVNIQSSIYLKVAEQLGYPSLDGTMWDYIHSKPPAMPAILKSGVLSQAKIYTLPSAVKQFLSDNKLKTKDYPSLMKHAEACRSEYFFRIRNPVASRVVNAIYSDFIDAVKDMRDNHGKLKMRTIERHCSWCDFEPLCKAEMLGHDTKFIMKREYTINEKADADTVKEVVEVE